MRETGWNKRSMADSNGSDVQDVQIESARWIQVKDWDFEEERMRELVETNARLEEQNVLKTKFVAEISHELRTALQSLTLYIHLLESGRSDRQEHYQAMLRHSIEHLTGFVEDTLNLSQLELNQDDAQTLGAIDLNAVVSHVLSLHQVRIESAGLELIHAPSPDLPLIPGDYRLLQQVVTNLVVNAIKYTPSGYVRVATYRIPETGQVAFEVSDSGMGIAAEDLPHIFDRFFRGQAEQQTRIGGTGLGLAIVKEIVTQHHGHICVDSRPGVGTRFTVHFPVAEVEQSTMDSVRS